MDDMKTGHLIAALALLLFSGGNLPAQSPDLANESRDLARMVRHPDGSRSVYKRQRGTKGMRCASYTASGKLAAINDYHEGKYGQLVGCVIYNAERQPIYKVNYGYDRSARLVEERMYSCPQGKLVQRVIYKYDAAGNRSKPLIISLDTSSKQLITPTMKGDENKIYREMGSGKAAGSSR